MPSITLCIASSIALAACGGSRAAPMSIPPLRPVQPNELRAVSDFASIRDRATRSRALFLEASRVFLHPRCVNCHPAGNVPYQGIQPVLHDPPVQRGSASWGVPGMHCMGCHQDRNQPLTRVPGAPHWHLAPVQMGWFGKSAAYVCAQLKDPARNDHQSLAQIVDRCAHDALTGWGWAPGDDREPAPGTQQQFGALVAAWVATGAECPQEESR
jgi:hypothetical protein